MTRLIIFTILTIGIMLFLSMYESIYLLYFEESTADKYAYFTAIPILVLTSSYAFIDRYTHSIKDNKFLDAIKYSFSGVIVSGLLYYFILVPVISGAIIMTNDLFSPEETTIVKGQVVNMFESSTSKHSESELTVATSLGTVTLDTNKIEINKYQVGDSFEKEMKKGFWGLLSK